MNKSYSTLIVVSLVSLVLGGAVMHFLLAPKKDSRDPCPGPDPADHAKYVVCFGDLDQNSGAIGRVSVDLVAFIAALNGKTEYHAVDKVEKVGGTPTILQFSDTTTQPVYTPLEYVHVVQRNSKNAPCSLHVTQKVGLNNLADFKAVLASLQQPPP